jgi:Uma2 family endonuclease
MATSIQSISLDDYLKSDYEPDAEYVDGQIEVRPVGENDHSMWQGAICQWFSQNKREWAILVRPELRVRVSATRFRVPDVTILDRAQPRERIITHAPLGVFEILSPEDRIQRMLRKLNDYHVMGIPEIWVVDPDTRVFSRYDAGKLTPRRHFSIASKGIDFPMIEIEAFLD